jgi:hypothetical protein
MRTGSVGPPQCTICIAPIDPGDPDAPSYERKRAVYEGRFHQLYERISSGKKRGQS